MELVYDSQSLEQKTKNTCKDIKEKVTALEKTIEILQKKRQQLIDNKKLADPPAGKPTVVNRRWDTPSILQWQASLRT